MRGKASFKYYYIYSILCVFFTVSITIVFYINKVKKSLAMCAYNMV